MVADEAGKHSSGVPGEVARIESRAGEVGAALCGVLAAWVSAGSAGLLAHPLRGILTLLLLGGAVVLSRASRPWTWRRVLYGLGGIAGVMGFQASGWIPAQVLACSITLAGLAWDRPPSGRTAYLAASWAIAVFGLYRFAIVSIPWFWLLIDGVGAWVARVPGWMGVPPLAAGATYAGLDYLVTAVALVGWGGSGEGGSHWVGRLRTVGLVVGAHLVFLGVASTFPRWVAGVGSWLQPAAAQAADSGARHGGGRVEDLVLWNLPAVGLVVYGGVTALLLAWVTSRKTAVVAGPSARPSIPPGRPEASAGSRWHELWRSAARSRAGGCALWGLAVAVPVLALLNLKPLTLQGKKVVVHEKGFLNWMKPKHGDYGRLSIGMYGMLPHFLERYGAKCVISPELSDADLEGADVAMVIYPNKPWAGGQLERLWRFVRGGGSLLVLGEHTVREKDGGSRINEVLEPTSMRVAFDSSMFAIGGWLQSYEVLAHPAQAGMRDDRNQFGVVIGASVQARWPARPMLVGRWGWADPGDPANDETKGGSLMGNQKYDAGEKVGDVLLAAEQRFGRGRVVVFGDTSTFTNGILYGSHAYVSRLFAAMSGGVEIAGWRLMLAWAGLLVLAGLLWERRQATTVGWGLVVFGLACLGSQAWTSRVGQLYPDGRGAAPNLLAYLDATHLERCSGESWRNNGLGGLEMTLMRDGYVVLSLPEFSAERLQRAGVLVSVAPGRPFSRRERKVLREFIDNGGIFICTVGYPDSQASRETLAELGFFVGGQGAVAGTGPEPKPFGHFKAPYYNGGDYMAYVRFHAAWPVESSDPRAQPLAYGPRDPHSPTDQKDPTVILMRRMGRGKAVVIADSDFATNQNLEREGGQPFEGMRENADFWRWLLSYLNDQPIWTPPKPTPKPEPPPASPGTGTAPGKPAAPAAPGQGPLGP